MKTNLEIIGGLLILLALMHLFFPKYFNWTNELRQLSLINRQMIYVHTFFIAFILLLMGMLCLTSSTDIIETSLGTKLSLGFGLFWLIRLLIQVFGYSSLLWKGKRFETIVHVAFTLCWAYFSFVFLYIYIIKS